jgi:hypothetical protein
MPSIVRGQIERREQFSRHGLVQSLDLFIAQRVPFRHDLPSPPLLHPKSSNSYSSSRGSVSCVYPESARNAIA